MFITSLTSNYNELASLICWKGGMLEYFISEQIGFVFNVQIYNFSKSLSISIGVYAFLRIEKTIMV